MSRAATPGGRWPSKRRHHHPDLSGGQYHSQLRRAYPYRHRSAGSGRKRVGVSADDEHSGLDDAFLQQQIVQYPFTVEKVRHSMLAGPAPGLRQDFRMTQGGRRREVIDGQHDPAGIPDAPAQLLQNGDDAPGAGRVVHDDQIHLYPQLVARLHRPTSRSPGQYALR